MDDCWLFIKKRDINLIIWNKNIWIIYIINDLFIIKGTRDAVFAPLKYQETVRKFEVVKGETGIPMGSKDERVKVTFKKEGKDHQYN